MIHSLISWILAAFASLNYLSIAILMAVESSFVPLPSEVVLPPAGWLAAKGELNLGGVIIVSTLGSVVGALFNYYLALTLGRTLLYRLARSRWAKFFLINEAKLKKSEDYFLAHGRLATFLGRLVPGVRHLISLPAGLAKMPLFDFILATAAGAALWSTVLTFLGYWFGANQAKLLAHYRQLSIISGVAFLLLIIYLIHQVKKRKNHEKS